MICTSCHERKAVNKKHELCGRCYQKFYKGKGSRLLNADSVTSPQAVKKHENEGEMEFVKNFFSHTEWIYEPATFKLNGVKYTPDFYDIKRGVFIEVAATRQAFSFNKAKYVLFGEIYPSIRFEIRKPSGELVCLTPPSDVPVSLSGDNLTRIPKSGNGDNAPDTVQLVSQVEPELAGGKTAAETPSRSAEMR